MATFSDTNTATPAGAFTATIAWGDNTTSAGTVNGSNGRFTVIGEKESGFTDPRSSRGAAFGDLRGDGRLDILVSNIDDVPFLYVPDQAPAGHWVRFRLVGTKCNRDAIGARVSVTIAGLTQTDEVRSSDSYLSCSDVLLHFGLGNANVIDCVQVRWPDGSVERHEHLQVDQEHLIRQVRS